MKNFRKQFGGQLTDTLIKRYGQSENWKEGKFQNLEDTGMSISFWDIPKLLYRQFTDKEKREPATPLPIAPFNKASFLREGADFNYIWYGHSALLIRMNAKTILIDPMLGPNASPIAPFKTKRFSENALALIDDFPEIDLMLLSHDHYDHLDYDSIQKLKNKTRNYYVALGVKRHLIAWGIDPGLITEFDWWNNTSYADIQITFTPSRHFSGRGLTDRAKSLWGGWAFKSENLNIWFSGDGGYGDHFKTIGRKLGPFDFGFMEAGQYNEKWRQIHMFPEESVQAALDAQVKKAMPVHWAGFALAQHDWTEPATIFKNTAKEKGLEVTFPKLGVPYTLSETQTEAWWPIR
ncbi:MBL fold metallo-hydrolase [Zobellia galactanivorans]|uniref:Metallo-beta-lactamase superfamily protein n=1 Tax=Zobellia galactanivorans (strain DSM 12802 / CCUG 47099 / CIP 106680 / NCIMB 13871 / Dsij) TaxID=63186 RepID=G0L1E8_ZOBGA|nr:MBL fold metallo-hydrolase [Zobellia galactanivorans]CAZ94647.1 Metallo-beta-lactamase superfamily protein [Zobellia galactanivorans]